MSDELSSQFYPQEITEETVKQISQHYYNLSLIKIQRLIGYDTINFLIQDASGEKFIFKVISCNQPPRIAEFLPHQLDLMSGVAKDLPDLIQIVVNPVKTGLGSPVMMLPVKNEKYPDKKYGHTCVVFKYIPGETMVNVVPFSLKLLEDLGSKFALLSVKLQNHGDSFMWNRKDHKWDPKNVLQCEALLELLQDHISEDRTNICRKFFHEYKTKTLPFIEQNCRAGLIHSDGNCNNVLVNLEK